MAIGRFHRLTMIGPFGSTSDARVVRAAESSSVDAHRTDPRTVEDLRGHAAGADAAVVTDRDRVTLLAAQLLRNACGIGSVVVQVNDPANRDLFGDLGIETLDSRRLLGPEVERSLAGISDV